MWCQKEKEFKEMEERLKSLEELVNRYPEQVKVIKNQLDKLTRVIKYSGDGITCHLECYYRNFVGTRYTLYIYPDRERELCIELNELDCRNNVSSESVNIAMTEDGFAKVVVNEYTVTWTRDGTVSLQHEFTIDLNKLTYIYKTRALTENFRPEGAAPIEPVEVYTLKYYNYDKPLIDVYKEGESDPIATFDELETFGFNGLLEGAKKREVE